ncbi:MAG: gliding motility-associated lipoprotein [Bacteroidetes bacterium GWB2_41_8]|nr:MAG: gliding motility-associated lipoprotein [Bacteroidetes bacterium GWB2_41_8]
MHKFLLIAFVILIGLNSCKKYQTGQVIGAQNRKPFFEPIPYGMKFIKQGSFNIGPSDQEVDDGNTLSKTVSVPSFWMDDTEITNNEYRQFVYWVRDSIARQLLSESMPEFMITEGRKGNILENPHLNWMEPIAWKNPDFQTILEEMYIPETERFISRKEIDTRKLRFEYYWIDYRQAAKRANSYNYETQSYSGSVVDAAGNTNPVQNRSAFVMRESTPVYPDTLVWIRDFTFSYNEPLTEKYFSHVAYDEYPVVGVTWAQAKAFCLWRTKQLNSYQDMIKMPTVMDYRLPTEVEWEYAARGGHNSTLYPWGNYYSRDQEGNFVANFKPMRGNYVSDSKSSVTTMKVANFNVNSYGLYDMAGNVAEWTSSAYDESGYELISDFSPDFQYNARPDDQPALKRKVIRGGSWKDIAYYIQVSTRSYEYQDTAKSYIGFRCVRSTFKPDYWE